MRRGGIWNFSDNSSVLVRDGFPNSATFGSKFESNVSGGLSGRKVQRTMSPIGSSFRRLRWLGIKYGGSNWKLVPSKDLLSELKYKHFIEILKNHLHKHSIEIIKKFFLKKSPAQTFHKKSPASGEWRAQQQRGNPPKFSRKNPIKTEIPPKSTQNYRNLSQKNLPKKKRYTDKKRGAHFM